MSKGKLIFKLVFIVIFMIAIIYLRVSGAMNRAEENKISENVTTNETTNEVGLPNPLIEVSSLEEMKEKLGYDIPVLAKDVQTYIVINDVKGNPYHGRIVYYDGNTFEIEKTDEKDISGIYGATFKNTDIYNGISADKYELDNLKYVIWQKDGFSYSYSSEKELNLNELMQLVK